MAQPGFNIDSMASTRLSQGLRHLLTLRSASAVPAPPIATLNQTFTATRETAQTPGLVNAWLAVAVSFVPDQPLS